MGDPVFIVVCDGDAFGPFDTSAGALSWMTLYTLRYSPKHAGVCQYTSPPPQIEMPNEENKA